MACPNWAKGTCNCKTQVRRELAQRLILTAIGQRILSNPAWRNAVLDETLVAWKQQQDQQPGELHTLQNALAEVEPQDWSAG